MSGVLSGSGAVTIASSQNSGGKVVYLNANTYSGDTAINAGTLALSTSGTMPNTPNITLASAATFDVSAPTTALTLSGSQTLKASATGANTTGTITVGSGKNLTLGAGLAFTAYGAGSSTAALTVAGTGGALALNGAPVTVTTTTALSAGAYKLIAKSGSATVSGSPGALTVNGSGTATGTTKSLQVISGELWLYVGLISYSGTPTAFTTTYGTASSAQNFTLTGSGLTANLVATAPTGFEVSSDGTTYGSTATFTTTAGSASGTLRVRLAATASASGSYNSQNIVLSSTGANSINIVTTSSGNAVNKATPTATLAVNNSPVTYDGTAQAATVGITASSVPGTVANILTGGAASQTACGHLCGDGGLCADDSTDYNTLTGLAAGNFVINKATPTATLAVNNSPVTYDGSAQAATVGITASSVPGVGGATF